MKTQKITSPLNTPSARDHLPNYSSIVSSHFPFQPTIPKPDIPAVGQAVSNGVSNPLLPKSGTTMTETPKEVWKSPSTVSTSKKSEKNDEAVTSTKTSSNNETKSSNKSGSSITKKRKNNKAGSVDEDTKKKQKTNSHERKNSYSLGAVGKGKMPILPPSPFVSKASSSSSIREM